MLDLCLGALDSRFGSISNAVIKYISSVFTTSPQFESDVTHLCVVAKIDAGLCVAQGKLLLDKPDYKPPNAPTSLQNFATKMISLQHHVTYKQYYQLVTYLLTLPISSATCERAHSKVDLVKTAVCSSMTSDRI